MSERKGTINVASSKGVACTGDFVYMTANIASGTMRCEDGRSGILEINRQPGGTNGYCNLSGEKLLFTLKP